MTRFLLIALLLLAGCVATLTPMPEDAVAKRFEPLKQLIRLGGPNSHEIPINRPVSPVHNNQRDGHMRQIINAGRVSYEPNSLGGGCPMQAKEAARGFVSYAEKIDGEMIRGRSEKFFDHFSQARLFWNSQSAPAKAHIVNALRFELGKVEVIAIRERMLGMLAQVDKTLANRVAQGLGLHVPAKLDSHLNHSVPADGNVKQFQPKPIVNAFDHSPALSMANTVKNTVKTRKVAFLLSRPIHAGTATGTTTNASGGVDPRREPISGVDDADCRRPVAADQSVGDRQYGI